MKFILQTKDTETQEIISEKKYESIRQIFLDFKGAYTYCTVHKNAMYKINNIKQGKKYTQQLFDKKYSIINIDE
jgi:hypothetical protein